MRTRAIIKPRIESITVKRLLSFGREGVTVSLKPLNVLIGPNGSGKSNFLETIRLLQAAPSDISKPFINGGGVGEWIWKGADGSGQSEVSVIAVGGPSAHNRHGLGFTGSSNRLRIAQEIVEIYSGGQILNQVFTNDAGIAKIARLIRSQGNDKSYVYAPLEQLAVSDFDPTRSVLAQFVDPVSHPVLRRIASLYESIGLYTDIGFGRESPARRPQLADIDTTHLIEDASNLALVLNDLSNRPSVWAGIMRRLRAFHPRIHDIKFVVSFGSVQMYFQEDGMQATIPSTRMSDGTLRYLFLLALLCHPKPPELICIEEPELGLHPDMIRSVAELLKEASTRTQVIVTTHSDLLVSALSEDPTAILVCDHDGKSTSIRRLEVDKLSLWLERYSLGELWLKGEIGGTRW